MDSGKKPASPLSLLSLSPPSPSPSPKTLPLGRVVGALRHFHLLFALLSHILFDRVFSHARTNLDIDGGIRVAVAIMNLITLVGASFAISGVYVSSKMSTSTRYKLECLSIPTDLLFAVLFLVKGALLNSTRLDCQVLLEEKFLDNAPVHQQITSLMKRVFGPFTIDDIDRQCAGSLFIYWVSLVAIISYTVSMLLTLVRLREYRKLLLSHDKKVESSGHVEMSIEVPSPTAVQRISSSSSFRSPGFPAETFARQERHDFLLPVIHRPRSSQETTSSLSSNNSEYNLLADVFRPIEEAPAYASRPASLHSVPSVKGD